MTRREWLAIGGAAFWSACGPAKGTGYGGYALVATSGDASLGVVDLTEFRVKTPIQLGASPTAVVAGPSTSYALTPANGTVHQISRELTRVRSNRLADEISGLRLTPGNKRLVAVSAQAKQLIVADPDSLQVVRRVPLDREPNEMDVAANDGYCAIASREDGLVQLVNLSTGESASARVSANVGALRFRADGEALLVANLAGQSLTVLQVPSLKIIADLPLPMRPDNLCFNSDQGQLFITGEGMDGVSIVFPYRVVEVEQTVLAGRDPGVMACSNGTPAYLFVGSHSGTDVCILDVYSRAMIGLVETGQTPTYITITPDSQYALILDQAAGGLAVIHIAGIRRDAADKRQKSGAALFTLLPVGSKPVHAAIVPRVA